MFILKDTRYKKLLDLHTAESGDIKGYSLVDNYILGTIWCKYYNIFGFKPNNVEH